MMRSIACFTILIFCSTTNLGLVNADEPKLLDDQFVLPKGFHIYRAATRDLTGGSYDLTFDGQGRILVGDGNAVRRLKDTNHDGIYDGYDVIADGKPTSGRGPQGLLVYGDKLYVVAGDGVQLFSGYNSDGKLKHEKRLGANFNTGGDHAAHTVLRGLDGYIYLVTGDGGGTSGRKHITEASSPCLEERAASVFRFDPQGEKWECIGSGGRNPPSLGMNYLGEFFSFDSDMEFHVDVPFYRPVSLNHWRTGADQGWQGVGAFRRYFIDSIPPVMEVGRGSPNWGVVYEHTQFPEKYRDTFIACDYRWKSATTGGYATSGRLVAFHLKRKGATWSSEMTELAKAKPNAKDDAGNSINFALVDVDVALDGSIFVTDHNQGIWRIFYDESENPKIPIPNVLIIKGKKLDPLTEIIRLPQPAAEWSRMAVENMKKGIGPNADSQLMAAVLDNERSKRDQLRALRLVSPKFKDLPPKYVVGLSKHQNEEVRAQAAWLVGIRGNADEYELLTSLLTDKSSFVRRRAAEALSRLAHPQANAALVKALSDENRAVRYAAMTALSHRPTTEITQQLSDQTNPQSIMRILVATHLRKDRAAAEDIHTAIAKLLSRIQPGTEDHLDFLRVLSLFRNEIQQNANLRGPVSAFLTKADANGDKRIRWEQIRLIGQYRLDDAFEHLVQQLLVEKDYVTQFHIASAISEIPRPETGWKKSADEQLADWIVTTQSGWFSEFGGKGLQFPGFWGTTLNKLAQHHIASLSRRLPKLKPGTQLTRAVFNNLQSVGNAETILIDLFKEAIDSESKTEIVRLLSKVSSQKVANFLSNEFGKTKDELLRQALISALGTSGRWLESPTVFLNGLFEFDDKESIAGCLNGIVGCGKKLPPEINELLAGQFKDFKAVKSNNGAELVSFRLLELMGRNPELTSLFEPAFQVLFGTVADNSDRQPKVIWSSTDQKDGDKAVFARSFTTDAKPDNAEIVLTCDNEFVLYVNGKRVAASKDWTQPQRVDITKFTIKGKNLIAIEAANQGGPAGLIASIQWREKGSGPRQLVTDSTWVYSTNPPKEWRTLGPQKGNWSLSVDVTKPTRNAIDAYLAFTKQSAKDDTLAIQEFWNQWHLQQFKTAFVARPEKKINLRSNESLFDVISNTKEIQGDPVRGRGIYLKAGCYACHGGIENKSTTIFGPALGGVTLRLKRQELADAIVYPSKQVVERFKASLIETVDGKSYTGFITEQTDDFVTITDIENKITRIRRGDIEQMKTQNKSLMPKNLLNAFSDQEIKDLLSFLKSLQ